MGVGAKLRDRRKALEISYEEVSDKLKIHRKFIQAIENDQYSLLPGGIYTRGFLRTYAFFLGLDADGIVQEYLENESSYEERKEAERRRKELSQIQKVEGEAVRDISETVKEYERRSDNKFLLILKYVMLILFILISAGVIIWTLWLSEIEGNPFSTYFTSSSSTENEEKSEFPITAEEKESESVPPITEEVVEEEEEEPPVALPSAEETSEKEEEKREESAPSLVVASEEVAKPLVEKVEIPEEREESLPPVTSSEGESKVILKIVAREKAWIMARVDGKKVLENTLESGETRSWEVKRDIFIRMGNAGGTEVYLNDKSVGSLGKSGEVVNWEYSLPKK